MAKSLVATRQEIINQCGDYIDHLISSMGHSNRPMKLVEVGNCDESGTCYSFAYKNHTIGAEIKALKELSNFSLNGCSLAIDFSDFSSNSICYVVKKEGERPDIKSRRTKAMHKLKLMQDLIRTIPNEDNITAEDFRAFSDEFHRVKQELQAIRRNDTAVDQYLIPFLKGIAEILLTCTIVLAPLAYYGLYRTTGENMTARVEKLIPVLDDEPGEGQLVARVRSAG